VTIAIIGVVNAGKTTLAKHLGAYLGAEVIEADALRYGLFGRSDANSPLVWMWMYHLMREAQAAGRSAILDSTGLSPSYMELVSTADIIIKLTCNRSTYRFREGLRKDRNPIPPDWYDRSARVRRKVDVYVNTSGLTPHEVFDYVITKLTAPNREKRFVA
jgi:hypothetical protein